MSDEEKQYRHYNGGAIVGIVSHHKERKSQGKAAIPYLQMQIQCSSDLYGAVKVFANLWGRQKIDTFLDSLKGSPGRPYYFRGFFNQFDDESEGRRLSNYTVYEFMPSNASDFMASFVLKGAVTDSRKLEDGTGKLYIHVAREGANDQTVEEAFEIYTISAQEIDGLVEGSTIEAKGFLRARKPFDSYGMPETDIRPFAMEIKTLGKGRPF